MTMTNKTSTKCAIVILLMTLQHTLAIYELPGEFAGAPIDMNSCYTADCSNCDDYTYNPPAGYMLSNFDVWENGSGKIEAIRLSFTNKLGNTITGSIQGGPKGGGGGLTSYPITKPVVGVTVNQDGPHVSSNRQTVGDFVFLYDDGSTGRFGPNPRGGDDPFYSPMGLNFLGFRCNFHQAPHGQSVKYDKCYGCVPFTDTCVGRVIDDRIIADMTVYVSQTAATQEVNFTILDVVGCGPRIYTLVPSYSFLAHTGNTNFMTGNLLTLSTTNPDDVGDWPVDLTVSLPNFPGIPPVTKSFQLHVICSVQTLNWNAGTPATQIFTIGKDTMPMSITYSVTKFPLCLQNPTFTLTPTPSFVTNSAAGAGGSIILNNITTGNAGLHPLVLTAVVDGVSITKNISINIQNPCGSATTSILPATLPTMIVNMPSVATTTQIYNIRNSATNADPLVVCSFSASISPADAFISLSPDFQTISVDASLITLPTNIGLHSYTIKIVSVDNSLTVTPLDVPFDVDIRCVVSSFTVNSAPSDSTYILNQGSFTTQPLDIVQNSACMLTYTYTQTWSKAGVGVISKPTWINFDPVTMVATMTVTDPGDVGVYTVTLNAITSQLTYTKTFTLTVLNDCTTAILIDRYFKNMFTYVSQASDQQNLFLTDTISDSHSDQAYCGTRTYTLTPAGYTFLSLTGDILTLSTSTPGDVGDYDVDVEISLTDYPMVIPITKRIRLTIACLITNLSFNPGIPTNLAYRIGFDPDPQLIPYSVTKFPLCVQNPTFTISPTETFLQNSPNGDGGDFSITGATTADKGIYTITLTAIADGLIISTDVDLELYNPCEITTIVSTPSTLDTMAVSVPSNSMLTQPFTPTTDATLNDALIVCNFVVSLSPSTNYISLSPDFRTILVDATKIVTPQDLGIHPFTITIESLDFSAVVPLVLDFDVDIQCIVSSFNVISKPLDSTFYLKSTLQTLPFDVVQQSDCQFTETITRSYTQNSVTKNYQPAGISFNPVDRTYTFNMNQWSDIGTWEITTTVTVTHPLTQITTSHSEKFTLTVLGTCADTFLLDRDFSNMSTLIGGTADIQSLYIDDALSNQTELILGIAAYCGQRSYLVIPNYSFISQVGANLILQTDNIADQGIYDITIQVWLTSFPQVEYIRKNIQLHIRCEILQMQVVRSPPPILSHKILIDQPTIGNFEFSYHPKCNASFQLTPQVPFSAQIYFSKSQIAIQSSELSQAGWYNMTLMLNPDYPNFGVSRFLKFQVHLINECNNATFIKQYIPNVEVIKQTPEYLQPQLVSYSDFQYYPMSQYQLDCGPVKQRLIRLHSPEPIPSWIGLNTNFKNIIQINFFQTQQPQTVQSVLVTYLVDYSKILLEMPFNVTLSSISFTCMPNKPFSYKLKEPPLVFKPDFKNNTFGSDKFVASLTPVVKPIIKDLSGKESAPSMIKFIRDTMSFTVEGTDFDQIGTWQVGLHLGYEEFPEYQVICYTPITVMYEPLFIGDYITEQTIIVGENFELMLGNFTDQFGGEAKVQVDLGEAANFMAFDPFTKKLKVKINPLMLGSFLGKFQIKMILTDIHGAQVTYYFDIRVLDPNNKRLEDDALRRRLPPPRPFIIEINQWGRLRVGITRPVIIPTFSRYPEFSLDEFFSKNCTNGGHCDNRRQLKALNMTDEESEAIQIVNRGRVWVNNTNQPIVQLQIIKGELSERPRLNFTWDCTHVTPTYLDFQLEYEYQPDISFFLDFKESIQVAFIGKQYFPAEDGQTMLQEESVVMRFVPQQVEKGFGRALSFLSGALAGIGQASIIVMILLSILLGGDLSRLWRAMIKLQIMVHLFITNVNIPANASIYVSRLLPLVIYRYFDLQNPIRKQLSLYDLEDFNINFQTLGYQSVYFVMNISYLIIYISIILLLLLFIFLTLQSKQGSLIRLRNKLEYFMHWNVVLQFTNQVLIVYTLSCFMQYKHFSNESSGKTFSFVLSQLFGLVILGSLLTNFMIMKRNEKGFSQQAVKSKYSTLFQLLNWLRNPSRAYLLEPMLSQLRVVILCASLIFLENFPYWQIFMTNALFMAMIFYIEWCRVLKERDIRFYEGFNEMFISIINYHMICFALLERDKPNRWIMGKSAIVFISIALIANFGYIFFLNAKDAVRKLRIMYMVRQRDRLLEELRQAAAARLAAKVKIPSPKLSPRFFSDFYVLNHIDPNSVTDQNPNLIYAVRERKPKDEMFVASFDEDQFNQIDQNKRRLENSDEQFELSVDSEMEYYQHRRQDSAVTNLVPLVTNTSGFPFWKGNRPAQKIGAFNGASTGMEWNYDNTSKLQLSQLTKRDLKEFPEEIEPNHVLRAMKQKYHEINQNRFSNRRTLEPIELPYVQPSNIDLGGPISQLDRVARRKKQSFNFENTDSTKKMFDELWGKNI